MAEHRKLEGKGICKCGRTMYFDKGRWWCPKATPKLKPTRKYKKLWKVVKSKWIVRYLDLKPNYQEGEDNDA